MGTERSEVPVLTGERVALRPLRDTDRAERIAIGRDPEFGRLNGGSTDSVPRPFTEADGDRWFAGRPNSLRWVIEFAGQLTGEVRLDRVDAGDRRASLAIGIYHRQWWDQGLGTESMRLVLTHAFDELGLHRVSLRVLAFNERAIAVYRKLGFVEEGRERESALIDGKWHDDVMMSVLKDEWRAVRS